MSPVSPWRTATFRLAVAIAAIFVVGGIALLAVFQVALHAYVEDAIRQGLKAEMGRTQAVLARRGPEAMARRIQAIIRAGGERRSYIFISNPQLGVQAGDLPSSAGDKLGFGTVTVQRDDGSPVRVFTYAQRSPRGTLIVIGRDSQALDALSGWMVQVSLWGGAALILLGLAGGLTASLLFTRKLEQVNAAATRIMDGRLEERLPSIGFGDEFDRLSSNLNLMLDRLQGAMTALRQVSADVAHDLRTPLTRLRNILEQASLAGPGQTDSEALRAALEETDEILQVFDALVRIAQIEGGSARQHFERVDLSSVIEHVVAAYQPEAEDTGHALSADLAPGIEVTGDGALLRQLMANLVENGLVHTPRGSRIFVSLGRSDGYAVINVADDGPGVPEGETEKISRRFYRLDRSRTTPGAGLGLSLAAAIVEAHGGRCRFTDNQPGLMVKIELPVWIEPPAA